jgi:hypothetical protein
MVAGGLASVAIPEIAGTHATWRRGGGGHGEEWTPARAQTPEPLTTTPNVFARMWMSSHGDQLRT